MPVEVAEKIVNDNYQIEEKCGRGKEVFDKITQEAESGQDVSRKNTPAVIPKR